VGALLRLPNGLELSCPAEAGNPSPLYARLAGDSSIPESAARRVSFSELLGSPGLEWLDIPRGAPRLLENGSCMENKADGEQEWNANQYGELVALQWDALQNLQLEGGEVER